MPRVGQGWVQSRKKEVNLEVMPEKKDSKRRFIFITFFVAILMLLIGVVVVKRGHTHYADSGPGLRLHCVGPR
jgi:hypothetical protein